MNKSELIDHVASKTELSRKDAGAAVDAILDGVIGTLKKGEEVRLTGFRNLRGVRARRARRPQPADGRDDQDQGVEVSEVLGRQAVQGRAQLSTSFTVRRIGRPSADKPDAC